MPNHRRNQRLRGRVLTEYGLAKVEAALQAWPSGRLSQRELSRLCGLNSATVNRLMRRQVPVDITSLEQLFAFLGLTLEPVDWQFPSEEPDGQLACPVTARQRQLTDAIAWLTQPGPRMVTVRGIPGSGRSWFLHQLGLGAQHQFARVERFGSFELWRQRQPWLATEPSDQPCLWLLDCPDLVGAEREWRALLQQDLLGLTLRQRLAITWVRPWQWLDDEPVLGWENLDLQMGPLEEPDLEQLVRVQVRRQLPADWPRRVAEQSRGYARLAVLFSRQWFRLRGGEEWAPVLSSDSLERWQEELQQLSISARYWLFHLTLVGGAWPIHPNVLSSNARNSDPDPSRLTELLRNGWLWLVPSAVLAGDSEVECLEAVMLFPGLEQVLQPLLLHTLMEELRADQPDCWTRLDFRQHPQLGNWLNELAKRYRQLFTGLPNLDLSHWSVTARRNLLLLLQTLELAIPPAWPIRDWFPPEDWQTLRPKALAPWGDATELPAHVGPVVGMLALESGLLTAHKEGWACFWTADLQRCFGWPLGLARLQQLTAVGGDRFVTVSPEGTWQVWAPGCQTPLAQGQGLAAATAIAARDDWLVMGNSQGRILVMTWQGEQAQQHSLLGEPVETLALATGPGRRPIILAAGPTKLAAFCYGNREPLSQRQGKDWGDFRQLSLHPSAQLVTATRASGELAGMMLPSLERCASPSPLPGVPLICEWFYLGHAPAEIVACLTDGTLFASQGSEWRQLRFNFRTSLQQVVLSSRGDLYSLSERGQLHYLQLPSLNSSSNFRDEDAFCN